MRRLLRMWLLLCLMLGFPSQGGAMPTGLEFGTHSGRTRAQQQQQ